MLPSDTMKEGDMPVAAYFSPKGLTLEQFTDVHRRLVNIGHGTPPHRLHHSCFGEDGGLMVFEVWDSVEELQAFGAILMPVLADVGIDPGEPAVMPVHKLTQSAADE
jgi:hypothetical protein